MLTTPTSVLYMESLAGATKGKVKAAEREAETKKTEEKEGKKNAKKTNTDRFSSRPSANRLAGPVMPRPNALACLQRRACAL